MTACDTTTENSGRIREVWYGLSCVMMMPTSSSTGSTQKSVPFAPPHEKVPIESASCEFPGPVNGGDAVYLFSRDVVVRVAHAQWLEDSRSHEIVERHPGDFLDKHAHVVGR